MQITLLRSQTKEGATLGELLINGAHECVTLEDPIRPVKVYGDTCIPAGRYRVIINESPRFKKRLPRLMDVPGFTGILIHSGNAPADTKGCILVGQQIMGPAFIRGGSVAMPRLQEKIQAALDRGEEVWITIRNPEVIP